MIELSNFDLSAIINKLNQGVTEDAASHGSEFDKILSAHLELSGIKSGIDSPLLDKLVEQMDISENSQATTFRLQPEDYFFDIESIERIQIASASSPGSEALPSQSENLPLEASEMKYMQESTDVFVNFTDGFKALESALSVNDVSPITTEQTKELPESTGVLVDVSNESKAFDKALFAYNFKPTSAEYGALESPKSRYRQEAGASNVSEALKNTVAVNFFSHAKKDPNTPVLNWDREGFASEFVLNHDSNSREVEPKFQSLLASSKITSVTPKRNEGSDSGVKTYSELELTGPIISEIRGSEMGTNAEKLIAGNVSSQASTVHAKAEENESKFNSQSGRPDAGLVGIKRSDNGYNRRLEESVPGRGGNIEQRSRLLNMHNDSYIETLSGQRQVLVGSRQRNLKLAELANQLAVKEQAEMKPDKTNSRKITLSQPTNINSTIAYESNIQPLRDQDGVLGLSRGAQNRAKAMVNESRVSNSKVDELRRHGQLRGTDAQQTSNSTLQDITKVLAADNKKTATKLDVMNELTAGRLGDHPFADQTTERRSNTASTNLQISEPLTPMVVREDQATEGVAKRTSPGTFQAELDFSGYDARRNTLREELDQRVGQLIRGVRSQIYTGQLNELQIKLHPRELGIITLGIELLDGNEISVKILNAPDDASKLIKEHWPAHWQDAGGRASNLETGEKDFFGNNSSQNPDGEDDRGREKAPEFVADSSEKFAEQDSNQELVENGHNIDITI